MNLAGIERTRIARKLREGSRAARARAARLVADADLSDALAGDIESESPPPIEEVLDRGRRLFVRLRGENDNLELAEHRESHVDFSARDVVHAMTPPARWGSPAR